MGTVLRSCGFLSWLKRHNSERDRSFLIAAAGHTRRNQNGLDRFGRHETRAHHSGHYLVVAGLALIWTPVPVGTVLLIVGLGMLVSVSSHVQGWVRERRKRHERLNEWMEKAEEHSPGPARRALDKTDPTRSPPD